MKHMTLRLMAEAAGGILRIPEGMEDKADLEIESLTTDSRKALEGTCFAAIVGERVDAHKFIPQVFDQGVLVVISEQDLPQEVAAKGCYIKVGSTLQAMKDLGEYYLAQLDIPVVGVAGSVGKTSTKEMIASILEQKYNTLKTEGNFNNELGVPLTIFRLRDEHECAVLEMGINHFGEMHRLAKIVRPQQIVMTNIGNCHLEFLGDRDGVLKAKTEIFDYVTADSRIILNGDDDKLALVQNVEGICPQRFGFKEDQTGSEVNWPALEVWGDEVETLGFDGSRVKIHTPQGDFTAHVPVPGRHMVMNAMAGTIVGLNLGLTLQQIAAGIEALQPVSGRFNIIRGEKYTVVDDCYNANPASMEASLSILKEESGRKVAILGDMGELGENEVKLHEQVGSAAAGAGLDLLICVGALSKHMAEAAQAENKELNIKWYADVDSLLADEAIKDHMEGAAVLVKASHFMNFGRIVEALTK